MPSQAWFDERIASTASALAAGDGCHPDEAEALAQYLSGSITTDEAAINITAPILAEADPPQECYRLWGLLCDALVELSEEECQKTIDLLLAIRNLPSSSTALVWSQLPGFASMWDTLHRLHLQGRDGWEAEVETLTESRRSKLREHFTAIGSAEAKLFVNGLVGAEWGFKVLDLLSSKRPGLDIFLSEIHAWLKIAGDKLRAAAKVEDKDCNTEWQVGEVATTKHWASWKEDFSRLGREGSGISEEGRRLAAACYDRM
ncbi:unnamed protein product [Zymoseptoria tritici ST99CH_1A5]|uniref:Nuclear pore complex protein Nup85 n=1 Tax=Zymoseptoria tritici ST99CH_1A5 TaxID=1276529 RepID=A0A1Y6LLD6_ZYMTR|nr:unnamed protein product [Zymoseptoria tritici ST99CH_3D1]SMY24469.1 unnamed protein product [Zymoseptoria tritici ST99CH_1A5]